MSVTGSPTGGTPAYVLGHSPRELERLGTQARLIDPITRRFLREAGVRAGMRVLDVGSGAGHTAFLAAELVGDTGEVVGVDRAPAALATARGRAEAHKLRNVSFLEGDPAAMTFDRPFDAAVGRYVLMFQPDPISMLRGVAAHVKRGGPIVFHEPDWEGVRSLPTAPIYEQCCRWIVQTLVAQGNDTRMGMRLHATFVAAGLPSPTMGLETLVGGGKQGVDAAVLIADIVEIMLPAMESAGVATAAEARLESLKERMTREVLDGGSVLVGRSEVGAWSVRAEG